MFFAFPILECPVTSISNFEHGLTRLGIDSTGFRGRTSAAY
jgi:hypothetical protein